MTFGMNRGEIMLVACIFGLIYIAGLLPKLVEKIAGKDTRARGEKGE